MAWEQRGDNRYYYGKRWQDGRCVSVYHGSGEVAQAIAHIDAYDRRIEARARADEQQRRVPVETARTIVRSITQELRTVLSAVLVANDYHQHKRQWRKRMDHIRPAYGELSPIPAALAPPDPEEVDRAFVALRQALMIKPEVTKKGKQAEAAELVAERERRKTVREVLDEYPCIWPHLKKLLSNGRDALLEGMGCNRDTTTGQLMLHHLKSMRSSLDYDDSPMLEQLLIDQVLITWLDFDAMVMRYAQKTTASHTTEAGLYWDRRMNSAQQRYLRALETLARVRRLSNVTPLQVNIGGQQVNVAGVS